MARPRKDAPLDLSVTHELTVAAFERLACPAGVPKALLRDRDVTGLRVRVTANGAKAFVYEAKLDGRAISRTLGRFPILSIEDAKAKARALQRTVKTDKQDPRELERQEAERKAREQAQAAAHAVAAAAEQVARSVTVGDAWSRYVAEGSPKRRDAWEPRYVADMAKMTAPGGVPRKRGGGVTLPGHLAALMPVKLAAVDEDRLTQWFAIERRRSAHQAARALMMFRGFLRWCSTVPEFRALVDRDAGKAPAIMDNLPQAKRRRDALEAAQVKGWWAGVAQLGNLTASAHLRALLLTGARREEMAALKWDAVDFRWRKLTIADKVGDTRTIPLTDYLAWMLANLPRGKDAQGNPSAFVFASTGKSGRIADPRASHEKAQESAAI